MKKQQDPIEAIAQKIIKDLNDRSGINIDFDKETMQDIYHEIAMTMATEIPPVIARQLALKNGAK